MELLLVKNVWCQRESRPFMHLLRHGMVGFGVGLNLGTVYVVTEKRCPKNAYIVTNLAFPYAYVLAKCFCPFKKISTSTALVLYDIWHPDQWQSL